MKLRRRYMRSRHAAAIDVTAFLSLMVILVPFLLITAVFSRMTILELESAVATREASEALDPLQLEVVVREAVIEVRHRGQDDILRLPRTADGGGIAALAEYLQALKQRFPDSTGATIRLEPQVAYDDLVQVMDAVRIRQFVENQTVQRRELFPQIALGDAPEPKQDPRGVP